MNIIRYLLEFLDFQFIQRRHNSEQQQQQCQDTVSSTIQKKIESKRVTERDVRKTYTSAFQRGVQKMQAVRLVSENHLRKLSGEMRLEPQEKGKAVILIKTQC